MTNPIFETPNLTDKNIEKIAALFPNVITEIKDEEKSTPENIVYKKGVNFELLKQELSGDVAGGEECYDFTWVGKKASIVEGNKPIRKTLRPCMEESKNWEDTGNLYIEGDNLDVLKLLQESYLNSVKMIYIDPPYNTGNDFIYKDNFTMDKEDYEEQIEFRDEDDNIQFQQNNTANPRYHSDWCSMMYPRLKLAQNLLTDDGVIFISIDDNEVANLRKICDEVFGESNFVATLVWDKNRKNDAKYFSIGHEYMLVYFKNMQEIINSGIVFRTPKRGIKEVREYFNKLRKQYGDNWEMISDQLKQLYSSWDKDDERKPLARFTKVDRFGPYRDDGNIGWPGGGGPKYEVLHPVTGKPCKIPDSGWRFSNPARMQEEINKGRVVFGSDETTLPRIRRNLFDSDKQVMRSVQFSYAQTATMEFNKIFDNIRVFENPKHFDDIKKLIQYIEIDSDSIVLDFFSGSATTAHAVMQLNAEDGGNRKFIMVQLPEPCDEKSEAYKAGYKNICEIGKERIRRAGEKIKSELEEANAQLKINEEPKKVPDIGFRVLKLDSTNMKDVYYSAEEYNQTMLDKMESNIKEDRTDLDLLCGVMLDWGLPLSLPHKIETVDGVKIHIVDEGSLIACFADKVNETVIREIAKRQPLRAVFRDSSFANSPDKINVEEIFKLIAPNTSVKVI